MLGRTPGNIIAIRPLKDGVIADFDMTEQMLRHFIRKVHAEPLGAPARRGLRSLGGHRGRAARRRGGLRQRRRAPGVPDRGADGGRDRRRAAGREPAGNMVVDIGGGTTEVAVISLGGIVVSQSIRIGGDELDEAISATSSASTTS